MQYGIECMTPNHPGRGPVTLGWLDRGESNPPRIIGPGVLAKGGSTILRHRDRKASTFSPCTACRWQAPWLHIENPSSSWLIVHTRIFAADSTRAYHNNIHSACVTHTGNQNSSPDCFPRACEDSRHETTCSQQGRVTRHYNLHCWRTQPRTFRWMLEAGWDRDGVYNFYNAYSGNSSNLVWRYIVSSSLYNLIVFNTF